MGGRIPPAPPRAPRPASRAGRGRARVGGLALGGRTHPARPGARAHINAQATLQAQRCENPVRVCVSCAHITQNVDTVNGAIRGRTHDLCAAAHVVCRSPPITPGRPGRRNRPTTHKQPGGKRAPRRQQRGCGVSARGICGSGARVLRGRESARVAALGPRPSRPLADRSSDMEPS